MVTEGKKRVRKSPEERKREIIAAAGKPIGEKGYYGTSLKDIADAIGMSQPGLLHYIGNKERLLSLLVTDNYDQQGTPADFAESGLPGSDSDGMLFPAYLRFLVRYNAQRRSLLQLYMVLETESFNADHPLHEYFENRPDLTWDRYSRFAWKLPPQMRRMGQYAADRAAMHRGDGWHPVAVDSQAADRPVRRVARLRADDLPLAGVGRISVILQKTYI